MAQSIITTPGLPRPAPRGADPMPGLPSRLIKVQTIQVYGQSLSALGATFPVLYPIDRTAWTFDRAAVILGASMNTTFFGRAATAASLANALCRLQPGIGAGPISLPDGAAPGGTAKNNTILLLHMHILTTGNVNPVNFTKVNGVGWEYPFMIEFSPGEALAIFCASTAAANEGAYSQASVYFAWKDDYENAFLRR